jgi:hypothetical protein
MMAVSSHSAIAWARDWPARRAVRLGRRVLAATTVARIVDNASRART